MRRLCDLHTHSTASDGLCPPAELIARAEAARLAAVALTDHDTLAGLAEAAAAAERHPHLRFVPGVEFSAECRQGEMHILGLGIDPAAESVRAMAAHMAAGRRRRNAEMLDRLNAAGLKAEIADLLAAGGSAATTEAAAGGEPDARDDVPACGVGGAVGIDAARGVEGAAGSAADPLAAVVGRAHFARLLVARGWARDEKQAFLRGLGRDGAFYVPRVRASSGEIIAAIADAGGLAVLAHPVHLNCGNYAECERIVRGLIDQGLGGLECYHSHHNDRLTRYYLDLARKHRLAVTGGSDFHGRRHEQLGGVRTPAMFAKIFN